MTREQSAHFLCACKIVGDDSGYQSRIRFRMMLPEIHRSQLHLMLRLREKGTVYCFEEGTGQIKWCNGGGTWASERSSLSESALAAGGSCNRRRGS